MTIVPTAFSPAISASRTSRQLASAIALKTSDVVEDRATPGSYIPMSAYIKPWVTSSAQDTVDQLGGGTALARGLGRRQRTDGGFREAVCHPKRTIGVGKVVAVDTGH